MHADGRDLAIAHPDARLARIARGDDVPRRERANHHLFEPAQVPVQVLRVLLEVDDGISDELPRAVKRDVAAALHLEQLHAARREQLGCGEQVALLGGPSQRDHGRVLDEEQEVVGDGPRQARPRRLALQGERVGVGHDAKVGDLELAGGHGR